MDMRLTDNVMLGRQSENQFKTNLSTVNFKNAISISKKVINNFRVKTPNEATIVTALSGGINKVCSRKRVGRSSKSFNFFTTNSWCRYWCTGFNLAKIERVRDKGLAVY